MANSTYITISKDIQGGVPVFAGTRTPVHTLFDYLKAGDSQDEFLLDFPAVTRDTALHVLNLSEKSLLSSDYDEAAA